MKKKVLSLTLTAVMALSMVACSSNSSTTPASTASDAASSTAASSADSAANEASSDNAAADGQAYTVGIVQLMQHVALDKATQGFQDALTEKLGDNVSFDVQMASGEQTNCTTIVTKFINDGVDLIMANATPAVIAAKEATSTIPIIGTSVTDYAAPETAIVASNDAPGGNVTGYSDLSDISAHVELTKKLLPEAKKVAIVYCSAEPNSVIQGDQAEELYTAAGFETVTLTASDITTLASVVTSACEQADLLYIPTDNLFAENMEAVRNIAEPAGIPVICGEGSMVESGATATVSIDYYTLCYKAGEMAYSIMVEGADPATTPIGFMSAEDMELVINEENVSALGLTIPEDLK